ncbi:hypothetical protein EYC80_008831 [Monilinia laxa]|uniref:Uncharacterized protein n=1 Tax=Monilinia laxa TaxID=61186 RepID=A0A5N6K1I8_MONLA|nr:hypothetical protein EYC80_008831 [Monilinia laxa]
MSSVGRMLGVPHTDSPERLGCVSFDLSNLSTFYLGARKKDFYTMTNGVFCFLLQILSIGIILYNFETIEQQLPFGISMNGHWIDGCIGLSTVAMWCVNWRKDSPVWHDLEDSNRPGKKTKWNESGGQSRSGVEWLDDFLGSCAGGDAGPKKQGSTTIISSHMREENLSCTKGPKAWFCIPITKYKCQVDWRWMRNNFHLTTDFFYECIQGSWEFELSTMIPIVTASEWFLKEFSLDMGHEAWREEWMDDMNGRAFGMVVDMILA